MSAFNPLSPNVADLQHFDIELFCGFSLCNAFCPSADIITVGLLVLSGSSNEGGLGSCTPEQAAVKTEMVCLR